MPKRISKPKKTPKDVNQNALRVVQLSTELPEADLEINKSLLSKIMSEMGRKGGRISGRRRMDNLSPEKRSAIALLAAKARWAKSNHK